MDPGASANLKETLYHYQKPCIKRKTFLKKHCKDFFFGKNAVFLENAYLLGNFKAIFVQKNCVPTSLLDPNHSCLSTATSAANNYDGW